VRQREDDVEVLHGEELGAAGIPASVPWRGSGTLGNGGCRPGPRRW
jgi:hypothetical protein